MYGGDWLVSTLATEYPMWGWTLDQALNRLFSDDEFPSDDISPGALVASMLGTTPDDPTLPEPTALPAAQSPLVAQASDHYRRALRAQRNGNWAVYGEEIERLGEILTRMGSEPL